MVPPDAPSFTEDEHRMNFGFTQDVLSIREGASEETVGFLELGSCTLFTLPVEDKMFLAFSDTISAQSLSPSKSALYGRVSPTFIRNVSPFFMILAMWHIIDILCSDGWRLKSTASPSII